MFQVVSRQRTTALQRRHWRAAQHSSQLSEGAMMSRFKFSVAAVVLLALANVANLAWAKPAQATRAELATGLYELAYSARQNAVFVASTGGFGDDAAPSKILRLDPLTLAVQQEILLPLKGFGVVLDDAQDRLYVGHTSDSAISAIDTASNKVVATLQLEQKQTDEKGKQSYPHHLRELALDHANHRLYAPGFGTDDSVLFVVDTRKFTVQKTIAGFGSIATGIALDAAGNRLFVSNLTGELITVDTRTLEIAKRYDSGADQPLNLAWDAAGKRLFATDQGLEQIRKMQLKRNPQFVSRHPGNRVIVIDPDDGKQLASVAAGQGPVALLLDAQRSRLYVTNRGSGTISVFDSGSYALLETVPLPTHPNSLALDARHGTLYVSVKNGSDAAKGSDESVARVSF
jgi:YVTN family beta-propeller protein